MAVGVALRRYRHDGDGGHACAVTLDQQERLTKLGYRFERNIGYILGEPARDAVPLRQLYSPAAGDHFCTVDIREYSDSIRDNGYEDAGVLGYVLSQNRPYGGTQRLLRLFHQASNQHFHTDSDADTDEVRQALASGFRIEGWRGIAGAQVYVMQQAELPSIHLRDRLTRWRRRLRVRRPMLFATGIVLGISGAAGGGLEAAGVKTPQLGPLWLRLLFVVAGLVLILVSVTQDEEHGAGNA